MKGFTKNPDRVGTEGKGPSFFIAGIIQGSLPANKIHPQAYRQEIKACLKAKYPQGVIIDPLETHPDSVNYGPAKGKRTFFEHIELASRVDVLVCYLPEASMGTALEMYEARKKCEVVVSITPLSSNWAIRYLSDRVLADIGAFVRFVNRGGITRL